MNNMPPKKNYRLKIFYYFSSILHICAVISAMTLTSRIIEVNITYADYKFNTTGGVFLIPFVFFIQDIVTEVYGYYNAKKILITTIIVFLIYVAMWYLVSRLPCISQNSACEKFSIIANTFPRHSLSFILSIAIGGTINNIVLSKLKLFFNGKFLAIRFVSATAIGELVFQFIAVSVSWFGTYSFSEIFPLALISYLYKLFFEIVSTPVNIYICRYLKNTQKREINYAI